jgi:hypothetical protein
MKEINPNLTVPAAIIIAGALIAGSLLISGNQTAENTNTNEPQAMLNWKISLLVRLHKVTTYLEI